MGAHPDLKLIFTEWTGRRGCDGLTSKIKAWFTKQWIMRRVFHKGTKAWKTIMQESGNSDIDQQVMLDKWVNKEDGCDLNLFPGVSLKGITEASNLLRELRDARVNNIFKRFMRVCGTAGKYWDWENHRNEKGGCRITKEGKARICVENIDEESGELKTPAEIRSLKGYTSIESLCHNVEKSVQRFDNQELGTLIQLTINAGIPPSAQLSEDEKHAIWKKVQLESDIPESQVRDEGNELFIELAGERFTEKEDERQDRLHQVFGASGQALNNMIAEGNDEAALAVSLLGVDSRYQDSSLLLRSIISAMINDKTLCDIAKQEFELLGWKMMPAHVGNWLDDTSPATRVDPSLEGLNRPGDNSFGLANTNDATENRNGRHLPRPGTESNGAEELEHVSNHLDSIQNEQESNTGDETTSRVLSLLQNSQR